MPKVYPPVRVVLLPEEQMFADRITFGPDQLTLGGRFHEVLVESCDAAKPLALSLLKRGGIPQIRLKYFTDPEHNSRGKSRQQGFESNGTRGEAILEHGNFLPYLRYFIFGPNLPPQVIQGFCDILNNETLTSGSLHTRLQAYVRAQTRQHGLKPDNAPDEFYKLAIECGQDPYMAKSLRDACRGVRT